MSKEKTKDESKLVITQSLAVRYRPKTFKDIIGQDVVVTQLRGAVKSKKPPGTILFYGPPGTGKTTTARVLARYLNCDTFNACGKCPSCRMDIDNHPDISEMNMASESGKDDAKKLIEKAKYAPRFRVRVFILDEFHQVSGPAEQTFLKPLEEPPPNTLWILCTTNPEKFKSATLTRCLKLQMKPVSNSVLADRLIQIASEEGMDLSGKEGKKLALTMANYSNGQPRDAISLLESVILFKLGNSKADLKAVIDQFAASMESNIDKAAARCTVAFIKNGIKAICGQTLQVDSCRALLMKMRWIAMSTIDDYSGGLKFKSYAFKDFQDCLNKAQIPYDFSTLVPSMLQLLQILNATEVQMNQGNIDERALFTTQLCNYVLQQKRSGKKEK